MTRKSLSVFDENSEPLEARIAVGLHKIGLALKHQTWVQANEEGLSPTQGQILASLANDGVQTGTDLAKRVGLTLPTISDAVRALVDKGLVIKKPDPRHPRASLISLTAKGRKRALATRSWPEFLATAVSSLSPMEQGAFHSGLIKMIRTLQEQGQIPVNAMCITCMHFRPRVHDGSLPHHCAFVDAPMAEHHLRIDCKEHIEASRDQQNESWEMFLQM